MHCWRLLQRDWRRCAWIVRQGNTALLGHSFGCVIGWLDGWMDGWMDRFLASCVACKDECPSSPPLPCLRLTCLADPLYISEYNALCFLETSYQSALVDCGYGYLVITGNNRYIQSVQRLITELAGHCDVPAVKPHG